MVREKNKYFSAVNTNSLLLPDLERPGLERTIEGMNKITVIGFIYLFAFCK